jgi:hypothetical protein
MSIWTFMDFVEASGRNPVADWLSGFPTDVQDMFSERLSTWEGVPKWSEKWASNYKGWKGLLELRVNYKKIPYRPLFTYAPKRHIILLCGSIEQNGKLPRADLETAERRRNDWLRNPSNVVRHKF